MTSPTAAHDHKQFIISFDGGQVKGRPQRENIRLPAKCLSWINRGCLAIAGFSRGTPHQKIKELLGEIAPFVDLIVYSDRIAIVQFENMDQADALIKDYRLKEALRVNNWYVGTVEAADSIPLLLPPSPSDHQKLAPKQNKRFPFSARRWGQQFSVATVLVFALLLFVLGNSAKGLQYDGTVILYFGAQAVFLLVSLITVVPSLRNLPLPCSILLGTTALFAISIPLMIRLGHDPSWLSLVVVSAFPAQLCSLLRLKASPAGALAYVGCFLSSLCTLLNFALFFGAIPLLDNCLPLWWALALRSSAIWAVVCVGLFIGFVHAILNHRHSLTAKIKALEEEAHAKLHWTLRKPGLQRPTANFSVRAFVGLVRSAGVLGHSWVIIENGIVHACALFRGHLRRDAVSIAQASCALCLLIAVAAISLIGTESWVEYLSHPNWSLAQGQTLVEIIGVSICVYVMVLVLAGACDLEQPLFQFKNNKMLLNWLSIKSSLNVVNDLAVASCYILVFVGAFDAISQLMLPGIFGSYENAPFGPALVLGVCTCAFSGVAALSRLAGLLPKVAFLFAK